MKIGIISDHRGYELKKKILKEIKGITFIDYGSNTKDVVDYPDYAFKLGKAINKKEVDYGIAICGSGIGMSIALNKVKGIRCARVTTIKDVISTRIDNDSNIIAFGEKVPFEQALEYVKTFVQTETSEEEKHVRRRNKIKEYEEQK